jgi:glycosyltransferase involved in cell wall biosynthesis
MNDLPSTVAINALFLEPRLGGLETYLRALVPELARLAPQTRFSVFCSPGGRAHLRAQGWDEEGAELLTHPLLGRRGTKAATELTVLGAIAARRAELLHSVGMTAPLWTRAVNVITLADVTWLIAPEPGEAATVRVWRTAIPPAARRADRLIALSEAGAEQIVEYLGVPRERIDVVHLAAGRGERVAPTPPEELRARLGLGAGPVVLTVAAKKVHKNLGRLVRAMAAVRERIPDAVLVAPGKPTPHERELRALADELGLEGAVVFPDYVDAPDLEGLYALAACFALPSINEGFGIPLLEAMGRGVPVACADASALPEVAGEAARYFDPYSVPAIAAALLELLQDGPLAARLIAAGRRREAAFTWEATARGTLASYARAWAGRRPGRAGATGA